jgi:hypothetical protein
MKNIFFKIYTLGFMVLTVFFIVIIWKVTFAHIIEEYHERQELLEVEQIKEKQKMEQEKTTFQKIILEGEETIKHYLGYRVLEEKRIEGHFHHIGFTIGPDKRSYCVPCHGDMPHDNLKDLRAFLNMHAFFVSCQTCHVSEDIRENITEHRWYDRITGELVESPVKTQDPGSYKAKILPMETVGGQPQRIDSAERIQFAREYRESEKSLSEAQRSKAKKFIHKVVGKQPHLCEDCHQKEKPLLSLEGLGYPKERIDSILSTEVVGMIKNYTQFYMPRMLLPGESSEEAPGREQKKKVGPKNLVKADIDAILP